MMSVSLRNIHNWLWRSQGYESYIIFWASGHYATCAAVQHPSKIFCMASFVPQPLTCVLWQQESCWQLSLSVFVITNKLHVDDKAYLVLLHPCLSSCWKSRGALSGQVKAVTTRLLPSSEQRSWHSLKVLKDHSVIISYRKWTLLSTLHHKTGWEVL